MDDIDKITCENAPQHSRIPWLYYAHSIYLFRTIKMPKMCQDTNTHKGSWDVYQPHILKSPPIPLNVRRAMTLIPPHTIDLEIEDKPKRD